MTWDELLAEVMIEREAAVRELPNTPPLEFGQPIAWATSLMGRTNGFTPVHRVGFPQIEYPYTACGERIGGPYSWLPLSPALVRTMENCTHCNAEIGRIARANAA